MTKTQKIIWIVFGSYMILNFVISLVIDYNENNLGFLIAMKRYLSYGKYFAFFGLLMFIISFVFSMRMASRLQKEKHVLEGEANELKARLFDMQESANKVEDTELKVDPTAG